MLLPVGQLVCLQDYTKTKNMNLDFFKLHLGSCYRLSAI